jgi:hypothetical protein
MLCHWQFMCAFWQSTISSHNSSFARCIDTFTCAPSAAFSSHAHIQLRLFSMPHFQTRAVIADPRWRSGYVLTRRRRIRRIACPVGGVFLVEYDVRRHLSAAMHERTGRQFAAPLALRPERDANGLCDLSVTLAEGVAAGSTYSTIVWWALACGGWQCHALAELWRRRSLWSQLTWATLRSTTKTGFRMAAVSAAWC